MITDTVLDKESLLLPAGTFISLNVKFNCNVQLAIARIGSEERNISRLKDLYSYTLECSKLKEKGL